MMKHGIFAHSLPDAPVSQWEPLVVHLTAVARRAAGYGSVFGCERLAELAGWWHDLGKASSAFQNGVLGAGLDEAESDGVVERDAPLRSGAARVDHSTFGARHAAETLPRPFGPMLAYAIAGHHGRLPDWDGTGSRSTLRARLDERVVRIEPIDSPAEAVPEVQPSELVPRGFDLAKDQQARAFQIATLTRMIYSALIDADRLATEAFCSPDKAVLRRDATPPAEELLERLNGYIDTLCRSRVEDPSPVDARRAEVLRACREKATQPAGVFSLTVPTGGGKTLASMAFALEHAKRHGHRRVCYALPFTSIIEQTAETFQAVFGEADVLEHHSNLDESRRGRRSMTAELAAENFDAPVIVTTNNQLFESLFAARGSACRKLHNLARSVIVLDEAQSIPPRLMRPALAMLDELVRHYGCTVLLCTATQPAVRWRDAFPIGLREITEIVPEPAKLYEAMRRVRVEALGDVDDETLAQQLADHGQVLCIVNTKRHAAELTEALTQRCPDDLIIHLSAAMCPQHRSDRIHEMRKALKDKQPLRVVSTQVIEAGVDVDFPVLYRAMSGFDSIAQAAGRCNREGKHDRGRVYIFDTDHQPALSMRVNVEAGRQLMPDHPDPLSLEAIEAYFRHVYWRRQHDGKKPWDNRDVMGCFESDTIHYFREAEKRFQWIDSVTTPVLVPYGGRGQSLLNDIKNEEKPSWDLLRKAQRFCVSVYENQINQLLTNTVIEPAITDTEGNARLWSLCNPEAYDDIVGLRYDVVGRDIDELNVG